jgi:hypothetical protein
MKSIIEILLCSPRPLVPDRDVRSSGLKLFLFPFILSFWFKKLPILRIKISTYLSYSLSLMLDMPFEIFFKLSSNYK